MLATSSLSKCSSSCLCLSPAIPDSLSLCEDDSTDYNFGFGPSNLTYTIVFPKCIVICTSSALTWPTHVTWTLNHFRCWLIGQTPSQADIGVQIHCSLWSVFVQGVSSHRRASLRMCPFSVALNVIVQKCDYLNYHLMIELDGEWRDWSGATKLLAG